VICGRVLSESLTPKFLGKLIRSGHARFGSYWIRLPASIAKALLCLPKVEVVENQSLFALRCIERSLSGLGDKLVLARLRMSCRQADVEARAAFCIRQKDRTFMGLHKGCYDAEAHACSAGVTPGGEERFEDAAAIV